MKTALYAESPELLGELREYCDHRGWQIAGEYGQLNTLMLDAAKRAFDAVVVWRWLPFQALQTFRSLGIEIIHYREAIQSHALFAAISDDIRLKFGRGDE